MKTSEKKSVSEKITISIIGMGNVAATLIKGLEFYKNSTAGLWHPNLAGYSLNDITITSVYDIDSSKVGKKVSEVIGTSKTDLGDLAVKPGLLSDPSPPQLTKSGNASTVGYDELVKSLKTSSPQIVLNLISSGMEKSSEKYAEAALAAGCSFFNATSARTVTEKTKKDFESKGLMILGDDLMSQFGGTAFHRGMIDFMTNRGIKINKAYQLDVGGNQDTQNTMAEEIREKKRLIKTESIAIEAPYSFRSTAGTTEYAEQLNDSRVSYYWMEGKGFLDSIVEMDISLRTNDSTNGCNIIVDSIRAAKKIWNDKDFGKTDLISAYAFKNPLKKMHIRESIKAFEEAFVK